MSAMETVTRAWSSQRGIRLSREMNRPFPIVLDVRSIAVARMQRSGIRGDTPGLRFTPSGLRLEPEIQTM